MAAAPWLPWIAAGILVGAIAPGSADQALGTQIGARGWGLVGIALAGVAAIIACRLPAAGRWVMLLAALMVGGWLGQGHGRNAAPAAEPGTCRLVEIEGEIASAYRREGRELVLRLAAATSVIPAAWQPPASLRVYASEPEWQARSERSPPRPGAGRSEPARPRAALEGLAPLLRPGDRVRVRGLWRVAQSGSEYVSAAEVALAVPREAGPRGWAWRALAQVDRHRGLAEALILGQGDPEEKPDFRRSGLLHILAVSGMHLVIAAAFGTWLLAMLGVGWWPRLIAVAVFIAGYTWLTGASPATQRALVMGLAFTAAAALAREPHRLATVSLAALALVLWDPRNATDVGFQLSLAAVAGIVTLGLDLIAWRERVLPLAAWPLDRPAWRAGLWGARALLDGLLIGVAATLAILPVLAWTFQVVQPWGPLATLFATPPSTVALWVGLPLIVLAGCWPDGPWEGLYRLLEGNLAALARVAEWAATWPGATIAVEPTPALALLAWPLLFLPLAGPWAVPRRLAAAALLLSLC